MALTTLPTHSSTTRTAFSAAGIMPVWPTMSQLAKLSIIMSYLPDSMRFMASSVTG